MADNDKNVKDTYEQWKASKFLFFWMDQKNLFFLKNPKICFFFQDKVQFTINGIASEEIKLNYLVSQLEPKYVENIWDIITNNPVTNYLESKRRLQDFL